MTLAVAVLLGTSSPAVSVSTSAEIDHLLRYIAASPCAFIRNGDAYDGKKAADHIKEKYEYYRHDVRSAEDFIALAATKSTLSGQPYLVKCGATPVPAADWLKRELAAFRTRS